MLTFGGLWLFLSILTYSMCSRLSMDEPSPCLSYSSLMSPIPRRIVPLNQKPPCFVRTTHCRNLVQPPHLLTAPDPSASLNQPESSSSPAAEDIPLKASEVKPVWSSRCLILIDLPTVIPQRRPLLRKARNVSHLRALIVVSKGRVSQMWLWHLVAYLSRWRIATEVQNHRTF